MRSWALAFLYAAVAAGVSLWMSPTDTLGADFLARTAVFAGPFRIAVWYEDRSGGCWLSGIWS